MDEILERLRRRNLAIQRRDSALSAEVARTREAVTVDVGAGPATLPSRNGDSIDIEEESIIMRTGRPVLAILRNEAQLEIDDPDSEVWTNRLTKAKQRLATAAEAVGRIEVEGHSMSWLGTGWLIAPDVIVTNRHVAAEFGRQVGTNFVFRRGLDGADMTASIDFLEELDRPDEWSFRLERILHIEDADGPDIAFCRVAGTGGGRLPSPIEVAPVTDDAELVAVIGYPARDSRIPEQLLMDRIYGNVYDKKRLALGQLIGSADDVIRHDCSTLGGNSGSVVLSLDTGEALGLHYAGRFLQANFAVRGSLVARRLDHVLHGTPVAVPGHPESVRPTQLTYVIPVRIIVVDGVQTPDQLATPADATPVAGADTDEILAEAVVADYADREGYTESFLGDGLVVPLPEVVAAADDVLQFSDHGRTEHVLRYEHFSVVMSRGRRLCRFSAVNIDGPTSVSRRRASWRTDPRIPSNAQISKECYGDPPKFSRGHMTRREDPIWGSDAAAARGNTDSMHVTNAVPQMQPFNGGVWLDLENYALQHARRDDMRISVFTGPFLSDDDPVRFNVKVPVEFWKVIAFIHDETGRLCATGYTMSQRDFLRDEEFVFGRHETTQTSIAAIEQRSGLSFGALSLHDPLNEREFATSPLTDVRQVRFV